MYIYHHRDTPLEECSNKDVKDKHGFVGDPRMVSCLDCLKWIQNVVATTILEINTEKLRNATRSDSGCQDPS